MNAAMYHRRKSQVLSKKPLVINSDGVLGTHRYDAMDATTPIVNELSINELGVSV